MISLLVNDIIVRQITGEGVKSSWIKPGLAERLENVMGTEPTPHVENCPKKHGTSEG